ncbi:unnamed protein product [Didymodactylos carnosus]|uniref:Uncharacterized protein n=1 Tax=Didymodactylos carnosus TaxID=1234261 RepID=A0A815DHL6_9BILA|nr:unnamed protein product [Didymodactylos carnosus]CAF4117062.1 unnamed protein product [Didymodactylos carnosus]
MMLLAWLQKLLRTFDTVSGLADLAQQHLKKAVEYISELQQKDLRRLSCSPSFSVCGIKISRLPDLV